MGSARLQERIEKAGGKVSWFGWEDEEGEPVAGMGAWRVNGNLGVSRSFGDRLEFPYVIAEPDVEMIEVRETSPTCARTVNNCFLATSAAPPVPPFLLPSHAHSPSPAAPAPPAPPAISIQLATASFHHLILSSFNLLISPSAPRPLYSIAEKLDGGSIYHFSIRRIVGCI